jgi:hypothetical protein
MEEASVLGKRIGIINAGKMKCIGTPLFLIERFGKFMSLNITKEANAENQKIVDFIKKRSPDVEYEILSEEIMFRIPKENTNKNDSDDNLVLSNNNSPKNSKNGDKSSKSSIDLRKFFDELDKNLNELKIKSYSASMPTLEDVFLNVAAEDTKLENQKMQKEHRKFSTPDEDNDKILYETDFREDYSKSGKSKFANDFYTCFHRRFLLTTRDVKGFLMEILCPILLSLIGLLVSQVDIQRASGKQTMNMAGIGKQTILYSKVDNDVDLSKFHFNNMKNITNEDISIDVVTGIKAQIKSFVEKVFNKVKNLEDSIDNEVDMMDDNYSGIYGTFLILSTETEINSHVYKFAEVLNSRVKHAVPIYSYFF